MVQRGADRGHARGDRLLQVAFQLLILQALEHLLRDLVHIDLNLLVQAASDQLREGNQDTDHGDLDDQEGDRALVDLHGGDRLDGLLRDAVDIGLGRCHRTQEEQRETERRVQEGGLHVDRQQYAEPDQVDTELFRHRCQQRHDDEGQLEVVQEERQEEDQHVHEDQEADRSARQVGQQAFHPQRAVHALEHQAEHGGTDQDEHHEGGQLGGGFQCLLQLHEGQAALDPAHDQGTDGTHGTAFGRRGHAQEDRAQHQEDQQQRRDQHKGDALGQLGQQVELEQLVQAGNHERQEGAGAQGHHDFFVGSHGSDLMAKPGIDVNDVAGQEDGDQCRNDGQHDQ